MAPLTAIDTLPSFVTRNGTVAMTSTSFSGVNNTLLVDNTTSVVLSFSTQPPPRIPLWKNSTHFMYTTSLPQLDEQLLENQLGYFSFYGIILPILTVLGCLGNMVVFLVFHHPEMRCLSSMFISAILVSDTFYLIGITVVMSPKSWLAHLHYNPDDRLFWTLLDHTQRLFLGMYPIAEMAQCLVVWYTVALTIEQYMVYYHPIKLWKYSTRDKGLQIITTIFIPTILVHMVHFFKFVRHDVFFHSVGHSHKEICLSDIYRSQHFQIYEKFLYYIFFRVVPWAVIIIILPRVIIGGFKMRVTNVNRIKDLKLDRLIKSGRSSKITILNILLFVIFNGVSNVMYAMAVKYMEFDQFLAGCLLTPSTRRFDDLPAKWEFLYTLFMVLYSCIKFPLCLIGSYEVRRLVALCIWWPHANSDKLKEIVIYVLSNRSDTYENYPS